MDIYYTCIEKRTTPKGTVIELWQRTGGQFNIWNETKQAYEFSWDDNIVDVDTAHNLLSVAICRD